MGESVMMSEGLCLSMIVKDEEKILARCLESVRPVLSAYEIVDTGSRDATKKIIARLFENIPGTVHDAPFVDFATTRNAALTKAQESDRAFSHVLLIDADMQLIVQDKDAFLGEVRGADVLMVTQKAGSLAYENVRIVRRELLDRARYRGRTHEYLDLPGGVRKAPAKHAYMIDHACGASRPDKLVRDERLLLQELEDNPTDVRSTFYLAQTYKDAGRLEEACAWYARRTTMGGWIEEVYLSHLYRGRILLAEGLEAEGLRALEEAYETNPERAEALVSLAKFHREKGRNETALLYAEAAKVLRPNSGCLFLEIGDYVSGVDQEISIAGFYSKTRERRRAGAQACVRMTTVRETTAHMREMARRNVVHYARSLSEVAGHTRIVPISGFEPRDGFVPMNPSIARQGDALHAIVRTVNYRLGDDGGYRVLDAEGIVRTENYVGTIDPESGVFTGAPLVDESDRPTNAAARIVGLEDMRLFWWRDGWWGLATTRDIEGVNEKNEIVLCQIEGMKITKVSRVLPNPSKTEKNWLPLVREGEELLLLYAADPTCWMRVDPKELRASPMRGEFPPMALDHLRGGSQLVASARGGYVYLAHEAIDMGRRSYLHRLVWVSSALKITDVSEPFFFEMRGSIEFAAGLARIGDKLIASYGVKDREAKLIVFREPERS
jgi:tetratricopeptide (TPR) repeat protein